MNENSEIIEDDNTLNERKSANSKYWKKILEADAEADRGEGTLYKTYEEYLAAAGAHTYD